MCNFKKTDMPTIRTILLLIILTTTMTNFSIGQSNYPVIAIDDFYNHIQPPEVTNKPDFKQHNFKISASKGILVDITKYDLSTIKKMNEGNNPDLIHIVCNSGTFIIKLDLNKKTTIDKTTAQNVGGSGKFKGFEKGEKLIIGLGTLKMEGTTAALKTFWVSMIDVE